MIILGIGIALLIYGFSTNIHHYDYMACGVGGFVFGWGLATKVLK